MDNTDKKKLNILFHSFGTVNHALIRNFKKSPLLNKIYVMGHNANPIEMVENLGSTKELSIGDLKRIIKEKEIDFSICFHELYTIRGLIDFYHNELKIPIFGCPQKWFYLEYSKQICKDFMNLHNIKTPKYLNIFDKDDIKVAIKNFGLPLVIKNNFLEGGFGSHICKTERECKEQVKKLLKKYDTCIAEKYVEGKEITQQYIWDKNKLIPFKPVKDFKKAKIGKEYINTGGLASYTPVALTEKEQEELTKYNTRLNEIFTTVKPEFIGIFCVNLMFVQDELYTLEFNMRPGITEFESTIENLDCDLLEIFYKATRKELNEEDIKYKNGKTGCVAIAHKDYIKQKKGTHTAKINTEKLLENRTNIIKNLNFGGIIDKKTAKISKNHRFIHFVSTDKNDPFEEIYKHIEEIRNKDFMYINREEIK